MEGWLDHSDWRLPNRRELRSLLSFQIRRPPLPPGHPFDGVFPSWYSTSTSVAVAPNHAWYVNLDGARREAEPSKLTRNPRELSRLLTLLKRFRRPACSRAAATRKCSTSLTG